MTKKYLFVFFFFYTFQTTSTFDNTIYCDALCGGAGKRLFPLSRNNHPKQFLSLSGKQTLLEDTLDRLQAINGTKKTWVTTTRQYERKVKDYVGHRIDMIVDEPTACNTAPAILLTCLLIADEDPNALVIFSPTDHYIDDKQAFADAMQQALHQAAHSNDIILLGVQPRYPATGYGYIEFENNSLEHGLAPVLHFHEKPSQAKAEEFLKAGNMLWNMGVFCASVKTFIDAFKKIYK